MASHGGGGNKFVSVNLNKSFGQSSSYHHNRLPHGSYGQAATGRVRSGGSYGGGGGGDGMVVLSRPRSSQKVAPKLSVPPPLNLPSLRKEHEKFDSSGPGSGLAGGSGTGSGARPNLSGVGWTKPGAIALQEKDVDGDALVVDHVDQSVRSNDGVNKGNSSYMPPSARVGGLGVPSGPSYARPAEKAMVLRGEDFPSLKAALPTTSGPSQKQRDSSNHKQKQDVIEESSSEQRDYRDVHSPVHIRPQGQYNYSTNSNGYSATGVQGRRSVGTSNMNNQTQKQEDYPLPLVRLNPRSDWADDERDTGHVIADWGRDNGLSRNEAYWDRDFDIPRPSILQQKPLNNTFEKRGLRADESGKGPSGEVRKVDPYHRNAKTPNQEGNSWRTTPLQGDGSNMHAVLAGVNASSQSGGLNRDNGRETKYIPPRLGISARDIGLTAIKESAHGWKDTRHVQEGRQHWNNMIESSSRRYEQKDQFGAENSVRYRGDTPQNKTISSFSISSGSKGLPVNDPILKFSREKFHLPKSDRPYLENPLLKDFGSTSFDERDPFSGGIVGVIKRKKEVNISQADLHDPVRESFEAELERVQKMQEMERQRVIEEQERILEQARREEEERQRMIRENEEQCRRLEEEAQEAAWRAEQERLEVIRRAEEQKIAREEEKRRIFIEEERRKHAAKQKLLELEAKIAQRRAEAENSGSSFASVANEKVSSGMKETDGLGEAELDDWEDSERMVERITTSASSDSSARNRPFVTNSRLIPLAKSSSGFPERGKSVSAWRKDVFENVNNSSFALQDQDSSHLTSRRDASVTGGPFLSKESYGGAGYSNTYSKGLEETPLGEYAHAKDNRWNLYKDGDPFNKNRGTGPELYENVSGRYDDATWGQGHTSSNPYSAYSERLYPNSEADEPFSYGRSRFSMKQPRVLPPPSIASVQKSSFRADNEQPGPSTSLGVDTHYSYTGRSESALQTVYFDESDESGDSPAVHALAEEKVLTLSENDPIAVSKSERDIIMAASSSVSADEDEEWTVDKNEEMQEQEVYDEDGYQEEDEVHEVDDVDLTCEFENMHLDDKDSSHMMDNLVLGFDEGVEVRLPSDEFDRNMKSEENNFEIPEVSTGIVQDNGSVDGKQGDLQDLQPVDSLPRRNTESASGRINNTEKNIQGTVLQPINDPPASVATDVLNDTNTSSIMSTASSSIDMALNSSCSQSITSAVSSVPNQADLPVKLQFGLFTGPSLIPSPVPAIQIGSIQMPLHLHLPLDPSITHLHTSHPPLFQFGQLGYTAPSSQGILPMAPQSMSLLQPNIQHHYNVNQHSSVSMPNQSNQDVHIHNLMKGSVGSSPMNSQPAVFSRALDLSNLNGSGVLSSFPVRGSGNAAVRRTGFDVPHTIGNHMSKSAVQAEDKGIFDSVSANDGQSNEDGPESQLRSADKFVSRENGINVSKGERPFNKEKKLPYSVKTYGGRPSFSSQESSRSDSRGFQRRPRHAVQRTEFRIRQSSSLFPSNNSELDDKSNLNGTGVEIPTRSGYKRGTTISKPLKRIADSDSLNSGPSSSQGINSESKAAKELTKDELPKSRGIPFSREGNMKMNISEEDVDAPSQSGVVHVFKQSGIEAPSDEDDFIEVRSKRQMLNDRRQQREKEIKAKSRVTKPSRKPRSSAQIAMVSTGSNKNYVSLGGETSNNTQVASVSQSRGKEMSMGFTPMASQQLAPIGTPTVSNDPPADFRSLQAASVPVVSGGGKEIGRGLIYETKNNALDIDQTPLGSWSNARISQQVMSLTQNQLDEAMKPASFEAHVSPIGGHTTSELMLPSSSNLMKDKPLSSSASPIDSLLAGEKIQFGAVTSPTVLPPVTNHVASLGIGAPGSFLSNIKMSQNISRNKSNSPLLLEKDKRLNESCGRLGDREDEAVAAASAVAVAAINSDKSVVNGLSSVSSPHTKNFGGAHSHGIVEGVGDDQQSRTQSRVEESLSVSLPADLSVETPPISSWPPLPSPQNSSSQMLSHFTVAPPSHFPFYEMNPMLGGPIFAFSPLEETGGSQSQSQKSSVSGPGPIGTWQQCHPSMDSFYGPPAGFTGPFISPPGGIPGVQAPPQMLVYNHYAQVGQFGQVGLSFMGTTYIPSGKQPDWKHNPTSSGMGVSDGDMNMISAQNNTPNMPTPLPHLSPGPPILPMPMASPMAMYDVSPFQSAPDMSVQGRWSHVPASPLPPVSSTLPLQQQPEGVSASQFSHVHPLEQLRSNRFSESQTSAPSDTSRNFPVVADARHPHSSDGLGLDTSSRNPAGTSTNSSSESAIVNAANSDTVQNGSSNTSSGQSLRSLKLQHSQQKNLSSQQYNHPAGNGYQRGGASQNNSTAGDWSHPKMGFHGRNHSLGAQKNLSNTKVRQIYVAKQTKGSSTAD